MFKKTKLTAVGKKNGAFTLVESLVAISILLVAVVEPLSLVANSIFTANLAKDQITAYYLAQEGIEFIRNKRDTNVLTATLPSDYWLRGMDKCNASDSSDPSNVCTFDATSDPNDPASYIQCSTTGYFFGCPFLDVIESGGDKRLGIDNSGLSPDSLFKRSVAIFEIVPNREAVIAVRVYWRTGSLDRSFLIRERIFNWSTP